MSDLPYLPQLIEPKWQKAWDEARLFCVSENTAKKKYYLLEMLPYPSGRIHMGHVRNYTIGDVAARMRIMQGYAVLHPMGWDAFGLPAENAAIKHGVHPATWTHENIETMRSQLKRLGFSYDWDREFATCDPEYYKWEQLIFLKMLERGCVVRKTSMVNWCPGCETVLANEQAEGGVCWRCESPVEMKSMAQWYFRTTDYAEELLSSLDQKLEGWPERVRTMQREWIGKRSGALIDFTIEGSKEKISVFTTRPDTLFGVTFLSLAYNHPLVRQLIAGTKTGKKVEAFINRAEHIDHASRLANTYEKEGVALGRSALHPLTGETIPIFAANFVLMDYGTGAVMAVPAHDQRDFEFAKKYRLPIKVVIEPEGSPLDRATLAEAYAGEGKLVASGEFSGMPSTDALVAIGKKLASLGVGGPTTIYKLKDWCVSRQRYWGTPIPIIHCDVCGAVPVREKDLPVLLPHDVPLTGEGGSPLSKVESFVKTACPRCGKASRRETDTMDTFVESSWYFFRYPSPAYATGPFDPAKVAYWFPIDQYIGGIEHAVGHLIYCRYFTKVLRDLGFLKCDEPVKNLMTQGMVVKDGAKMSKSKGNIVDPDDMIARYGADTCRVFSLFAAPPEKDLIWSDQGIEGAWRFLVRIWRLVTSWCAIELEEQQGNEELLRWQHRTIKRVTEDIERWHFNTAIAAIMEYLNFLSSLNPQNMTREAMRTLVVLLSPFAPHVADELWQALGEKGFVLQTVWPRFDLKTMMTETIQIVVQVDGKLRDKLQVAADADEASVTALALASEKISLHLKGKPPRKVHYVPKRLLNLVTH